VQRRVRQQRRASARAQLTRAALPGRAPRRFPQGCRHPRAAPPMRGAKQKPNEACACGSGAKYKKCCAGRAPLAAAPPARAAGVAAHAAGGSSASLVDAVNAVKRYLHEASNAHEAADTPRALRRLSAALALSGTALGACAAGAPGATSFVAGFVTDGVARAPGEDAGRAQPLTVADVVLEDAVQALDFVTALHAGAGRLSDAEDAHARCLALLTPPHAIWAHGLCTLSHAAWRDAPCGAADVRIGLSPDAVRPIAIKLLSGIHLNMGLAYSAAQRLPEALRSYQRALAALAAHAPGSERDLVECSLWENCGNVWARGAMPAAPAQAAACYAKAGELLERGARGEGADAARVAVVRRQLRANADALRAATAMPDAAPLPPQEDAAARLPGLEATWAEWEAHKEALQEDWTRHNGGPVVCCVSALGACDTPAAQRPWLRRAAALFGVPAALRAAAHRGCRACGAPLGRAAAPADAAPSQSVKLCAGCGRVAYCDAACQAADWRRHKRHCGAQPGSAAEEEAVLSDAICVVCFTALLPEEKEEGGSADDGGGGDAAAAMVTLQKCAHLAHSACLERVGGCPVCARA
jgi:hypothetical protein